MQYKLLSNPDENEWNEFVDSSPQGNIFSDIRFLTALNAKYTRYFVKAQHGEILAGVVIIEDNCSMHEAPCMFAAYQGILFSRAVSILSGHKRVTREFRLTEYLIQALSEYYGNFNMSLSPTFRDLRPFLWYNYHETDLPHFAINNRFTATIKLNDFQLEDYLKSIRTVRRQEFKKSTAKISETKDLELFLDLYVKTFKRQNIVVDSQDIELVNRIITSGLKNDFGRLSMAVTDDGVASMSFFVYDSNCAYYLLGANNPEFRNSGASTALMIDNICFMAKLGLNKLDFIGVNSPNRGDYKLSFNSVLTPFFEVKLDSTFK